MAELQPPRAEPTMAAPSAAAAVAPSARVMRQRLEDPFTKQRLARGPERSREARSTARFGSKIWGRIEGVLFENGPPPVQSKSGNGKLDR